MGGHFIKIEILFWCRTFRHCVLNRDYTFFEEFNEAQQERIVNQRNY